VTIFPIILDSKPDYLGEHSDASLLQLPLGEDTFLGYFGRRLMAAARRPVTIVRTFDASGAYVAFVKASGVAAEESVPAHAFPSRLTSYEPSDWLLIVDPRYFAVEGFDPGPLLRLAGAAPHLTQHLVALEHGTAGTNERVEFDLEGRVRRVQRYYDSLTWSVASGVSCSLVPVSALTMARMAPFTSAADLRRALATTSAPSRDVPIHGMVVDLSHEQALLAVQGRLLTALAAASGFDALVAATAHVHDSARLVGAVAVHAGADIGEDAIVVGPAVIGAGARVERGAVVAQCVLAPGATAAAGAVLRHRLVAGVSTTHRSVDADPDDPLEDGQLPVQRDVPRRSLYPTVKMILEAAIAISALIVLAPLLLLLAILVKLDSRGPIFFGDPRESRDGEVFRCFKFRTMRTGADAAQRDLMAVNQVDGPQFKMDHDPRVTRLGYWLRKLSLDELPQLFNVAVGQMSLVGPRPSPFRENQTCVPWRDARLSVRPGITGLWQVCRHERQLGDFHQWIYYDIKYVHHMSLWVDLKIIAATIFTLGGKGHVPLSWIIPSAEEHA
jgi:lipopolysaccharide/colanic/teichoic acid biosynthesis glycosyltransferase